MTDEPFRKWFIRTIRKGRVKITGVTYAPDEKWMIYDGRLDGLRFAFARYRNQPGLLALWGTEEAYRSDDAQNDGAELVDGKHPWCFWHEVTP